MKYYVISAFYCFAVCLADKLNNIYLPPSNSISAGGNGNFLKAPINRGFLQPGSQFSYGDYRTSQQKNIYPTQQQSFNKNSESGSLQPQIAILRFNNDKNGDGSYRFEYETANKIIQQESGQLKNVGTDQESNAVQGSYSFVGLDGQTYTINYVADELGFRATGDHLPVAPPIPAEIQKALEQNAADEARGIVDDGQYKPEPSSEIDTDQINRKYLAPKVQGAYQQKGGYSY